MRKIASWLILALFAVLLTACSAGPEYKRVQLTAPGQAQPNPSGQPTRAPLRVAISGVISPKETFKTYQDLLQYISKKLNRPVELVQRKTYAEVNDLIRDGGIDLAFVCTLAYVQGQQDFGMELIAAPVINGEPLYRAYVIVPADSPVVRLEQLRGKTFAFTDPNSNTGRLYPTYLLWQSGENPDGFFRSVVFTYSHDNSIKAVADRMVDAASVDSLVYEAAISRNPELAERTRVLLRSVPFGAPPVVVHPALSPDLKEALSKIILGLDVDPEGQAILSGLGIDRFMVPDQAIYEPVRQMVRELRGQR
ncbi:MAG: phosphate/phosphite/phosphonate ABC transporter substrate-binding protein [Chloroflexi bacterium]|nr:phosphate/phosphite/phosphonate ABC transporter substrate-binding protein [Chloroflexota bacterium]MCL5108383.1 phosphate/phosphite/phosphonate ABC transporter substrate-binding protein [Chloroflexota bacterium]